MLFRTLSRTFPTSMEIVQLEQTNFGKSLSRVPEHFILLILDVLFKCFSISMTCNVMCSFEILPHNSINTFPSYEIHFLKDGLQRKMSGFF